MRQGHSHTTLPWVLNSGASEGLLACCTYCVTGFISDLPPYWRSQPGPLHLPEPKRMELIGNVPGEFLFVCLFFASKCFSHSFAY